MRRHLAVDIGSESGRVFVGYMRKYCMRLSCMPKNTETLLRALEWIVGAAILCY